MCIYKKKEEKNSTTFFILSNTSCDKLSLSESKVLQYFGNIRHNSAILDTFADVMKVINHTGLSEVELA